MIKSDANMSDTRRRRHKSDQSHASDDLSDSFDELVGTKETLSNEPTEIHRDSEYDTVGSEGESDGGSQDGVQRESGDGQEEDKPPKKLDDDEDRRNPQYIPKRGTFYEHDDRTAEETAEDTVEQPAERESKDKKVWKDKEDRWDHDRYNDDEQAPKSHEELIAVYGYDIRNEEGPPRARRRRRYGRGPNKYTRNWEDEDAYGKTPTNISTKQNRRSNKTGEEFPALGGSTKDNNPDTAEEPVISSAWYSNKNKYHSNKQQNAFPPLQSQQENHRIEVQTTNNTQTNENKAPNEPTNPAWKKDATYTHQSLMANMTNVADNEKTTTPTTVNVKPVYVNRRQVQESVSLAASRVRGRGFKPTANNNLVTNRTSDSKPKGRGSGLITGGDRRNNTSQRDDEQLVNEVKHMNINDGSMYHHGRQQKNFYGQVSSQQRSNAALPRMQQPPMQQQQPQSQTHSHSPSEVAGSRPKRYSSLRQRPAIPDGPGQQNYQPQHGPHGQHNQHGPHAQHSQHGQHGFYPPQGGNSHGVIESQGFPQNHFDQTPQVPSPANTLTPQSVIPLSTAGQPGSFAPPPFLVPTPQFIAPQTAPPSIINYVSGPNGPAFPPNFQGYQGYNPSVQPPVPQPPPELYQPQGCTYYSPAQQPQQVQQIAPLRRPKAAIPILPPPDNSIQRHQNSRGRGRNTSQTLCNNAPGGQLIPGEQQQFQQIDTQQCVPIESLVVNSSNDAFDNSPVEQIEKNSEITVTQMSSDEKNIVDDNTSVDSAAINENVSVDNNKLVENVMVETSNENITEKIDENIIMEKIDKNLTENMNENVTEKIDEIIYTEEIKEPAVEINNLNNDIKIEKTNEIDNSVVSVTQNDCKSNIDKTAIIVDNNSNNTSAKSIEVEAAAVNETEINNKVDNVVPTPVVEEAAA
ncbi:protein CASC3 isoform X1 [Microplitis demolitor]|uniref:protein CASC3 isoform X1 n=1 Tax=Microplitis demolitor TaxID=69319 RepID=UPI0004CD77CB|nr:protein CASC3 isoform X1 [Microplitis demolitor]